MLSNAVLERAFLGAEPGELCLGALLLLMAQYQGRHAEFFPRLGGHCSRHTTSSDLVALSRAGRAGVETGKLWPCRKALRHARGGKCPTAP